MLMRILVAFPHRRSTCWGCDFLKNFYSISATTFDFFSRYISKGEGESLEFRIRIRCHAIAMIQNSKFRIQNYQKSNDYGRIDKGHSLRHQ